MAITQQEQGMDNALARARDLTLATGAALNERVLGACERAALQEIRDVISKLEHGVREARLQKDAAAKSQLISEVEPLRRDVIDTCHAHQGKVHVCQGLVRDILDWCELRNTPRCDSGLPPLAKEAAELSAGRGAGSAAAGWLQGHMPHGKAALKAQLAAASHATGSPKHKAALSQQQQLPPAPPLQQLRIPAGVQQQAAGAGVASLPPVRRASLPDVEQLWPTDQAGRERAVGALAAAAGAEGSEQQQPGWQGARQASGGSSGTPPARSLGRQQRSFLDLDRDDVSLSLAGQLPPSDGGSSGGGSGSGLLRSAPRYTEPDFLRTSVDGLGRPQPAFTPMVLRAPQRSTPFTPGVGGGSASGAVRSSLQSSHDFSAMLRSGACLADAAYLSAQSSRVYVMHDAIARKSLTVREYGAVDVPHVPPCLAVGKRRPWWLRALRFVACTAGMTAALLAVAVRANEALDAAAAAEQLAPPTRQQQRGREEEQQASETAVLELPFAPMGPAPAASAGCG